MSEANEAVRDIAWFQADFFRFKFLASPPVSDRYVEEHPFTGEDVQ